MARRRSSRDDAETIVALLVAIVALAFLLYLPFIGARRTSSRVLGFVGATGLVGTLIWAIATQDGPTPKMLEPAVWATGALYTLGIVLRVLPGGSGESNTGDGESTGLLLGGDEVVLHRSRAELLGDSRVRAHLGLGTRVGRLFGGGGLSFPIRALVPVDDGRLYVTNERVVFTGQRANRSLPTRKILEVEWDGEDAVTFRPARGTVLLVEVEDGRAVQRAAESAVRLARSG